MNPLNPNYTKILGANTNKRREQFPSKSPAKSKTFKKAQIISTSSESSSSLEQKHELHAQFPLNNSQLTSNLTLFSQGYLFAYTTKSGVICGRNIIIFPQGIIANCFVQQQQLHGWAVIFQKNTFFNVCYFRKGQFEGKQYSYDIQKGIMVESIYRRGQLLSINRYVSACEMTFEQFIQDKKLIQLLKQTEEGNYFKTYFPTVKSSIGNYYGQVVDGIPEELGVVMTENELFYGQFEYGLLSGKGVIVFQSGNYYIGQFEGGNMKGLGHYSISGRSKFKFQNHTITEQQFYRYFDLYSLNFNQSLSKIFNPMITFYHKLKNMYQKKSQEEEEDDSSLIDINTGGQRTGRSHRQQIGSVLTDQRQELDSPRSPLYSAHQINEFRKTLTKQQQSMKEEEKNKQTQKQIQPQVERVSTTQRNYYEEAKHLEETKSKKTKENTQQDVKKGNKRKGKQGLIVPKAKDKNYLANESQWQAVIEQLSQQSIARQDAFLKASDQKIQNYRPPQKSPKYNEMNARVLRKNFVKIKAQQEDDQVNLQKQFDRVMNTYNH